MSGINGDVVFPFIYDIHDAAYHLLITAVVQIRSSQVHIEYSIPCETDSVSGRHQADSAFGMPGSMQHRQFHRAAFIAFGAAVVAAYAVAFAFAILASVT